MAIVLDGTTGITTPSVASTGASTFTGALALPSGGLNVGSGQLAVDASGRVTMSAQPQCLVSPPTGFSVAANTDVTVTGTWTAHQNTGSYFNTTTGIFTAPVGGTYIIVFSAFFTASSAYRLDTFILINGTAKFRQEQQKWSTSNYNNTSFVTGAMKLAANDQISFGVYSSSATTLFSSALPWSYASIVLLS
jgi:hypothetical protein